MPRIARGQSQRSSSSERNTVLFPTACNTFELAVRVAESFCAFQDWFGSATCQFRGLLVWGLDLSNAQTPKLG